MTIVFQDVPAGADATITSFLGHFVESGAQEQMPPEGRFDPHDVSLSDCLRMYYVVAADPGSGLSLQNAQARGWRYLLFSKGSPVNDVCVSLVDGELEVCSLSIDTPLTGSTVAALLAAEDDARVQQQNYEARQLYCLAGGACVVSLWLHGSQDDLLVPMEPSIVGGAIDVHKVYKAQEVLDWLKTSASAA
jgi:hypothetical protein